MQTNSTVKSIFQHGNKETYDGIAFDVVLYGAIAADRERNEGCADDAEEELNLGGAAAEDGGRTV